jgi:hypothetical protein
MIIQSTRIRIDEVHEMVEAAVLEEPVAKRGLPRVAERSVELLEHASYSVL